MRVRSWRWPVVDIRIPMDQDVSEAGHLSEGFDPFLGKEPVVAENHEYLRKGFGCLEALGGDDVCSRVDRRLDSHDQSVLRSCERPAIGEECRSADGCEDLHSSSLIRARSDSSRAGSTIRSGPPRPSADMPYPAPSRDVRSRRTPGMSGCSIRPSEARLLKRGSPPPGVPARADAKELH